MKRVLLWLPGLPLASAAGLVVMGLGMVRHLPPGLVVGVATAAVLLPCAALASVFKDRVSGFALGLLVWPPLLLATVPAYFPGERADALSTGLVTMAWPTGLDLAWVPVDAIDRLLPAFPEGREVPGQALAHAPAEVAPVMPMVAATARADHLTPTDELSPETVVLPYEGTGRSLSVPVTLEQGEAEEDVWMLFDTGATLTTVDLATLRRLGLRVPADAPELEVRTANGERVTKVVLIDRLWIAGLEVEGVSVSVCEECASEESVGLLGLNVSGRFLVTVDQARRELLLQVREGAEDRSVDVAPWLDIEAQATRWPDGRVEVEVDLENTSPRELSGVEVAIECEDTWVARFDRVAAGGSANTVVALPRDVSCETYRVRLERALW